MLVVVVFEVEVGTRELGLDNLPEPGHWRTKRDVRGTGWTRATGEEGNELAESVDDDGPTVPTPGERTGVVVTRVDYCFHPIAAAKRGVAVFYNVSGTIRGRLCNL